MEQVAARLASFLHLVSEAVEPGRQNRWRDLDGHSVRRMSARGIRFPSPAETARERTCGKESSAPVECGELRHDPAPAEGRRRLRDVLYGRAEPRPCRAPRLRQ